MQSKTSKQKKKKKMATFRNFPARNLEGRYQGVEVLTVSTPSRFYVHLPDPEGKRARLLAYYANTTTDHLEVRAVEEEDLYPGAPVYVRHIRRFYRGVVTGGRDQDGDIPVWLGDWALELNARPGEMFTVPWEHRSIGFQAIACGLHATRPMGEDPWSPETIQYVPSRTVWFRDQLEYQYWNLHVMDRETGTDAIWVALESPENDEEPIRDRLIRNGHGQWGPNPRPFDWGEDGGRLCLRAERAEEEGENEDMAMEVVDDENDQDDDEWEEWEDEDHSDEGYGSDDRTDDDDEEERMDID